MEVVEVINPQKMNWMSEFAARNGLKLVLDGECGFGRPCVGIVDIENQKYPDYEWYDGNNDRADFNGLVWTPEGAYHKHPCVAVLDHSSDSVEQLYQWLCWFDENGFSVQRTPRPYTNEVDAILHGRFNVRMVKCSSTK